MVGMRVGKKKKAKQGKGHQQKCNSVNMLKAISRNAPFYSNNLLMICNLTLIKYFNYRRIDDRRSPSNDHL